MNYNSLNITEILGPRINNAKFKREYSISDKSYIYKIEGQRSNQLQLTNLPATSRGSNAYHYLAIQIHRKKEENFSITITVRDEKNSSFIFCFSTVARKPIQDGQSNLRPTTSGTSQLIGMDVPKGPWVTIYFDLESICQRYWHADSYHELTKIEISPTCHVRWIYAQEDISMNEFNSITIPSKMEYPNGIANVTILVPSDSPIQPPIEMSSSPNSDNCRSNQKVRTSTISAAQAHSIQITLPDQSEHNKKPTSSQSRRPSTKKKIPGSAQKGVEPSEQSISVSPVPLKRAEKIEEKYDKERVKPAQKSIMSTKSNSSTKNTKHPIGFPPKSIKKSKIEATVEDQFGASIKMRRKDLVKASNSKLNAKAPQRSQNEKVIDINYIDDDEVEIESGADIDGDENIIELGEDDQLGHGFNTISNNYIDDDVDSESSGSAFGGTIPHYQRELLDEMNSQAIKEEEEELELVYISSLNCYYCPSNQQYYQIENDNELKKTMK